MALPPRILVVDDSTPARAWVVALAEDVGATAAEATGGEEAVERLREDWGFDLVLVDFEMPGLSGPATVLAIREMEVSQRRRSTRLVGLSADASSRAAVEFMAAGADDELSKPLTPAALAAQLRALVPTTSGGATATTPVADPQPSSNPVGPLDWDEAVRKTGLPAEVLITVARTFVQEATEKLATGSVAVAAGDLRGAARVAHALRGSAALFEAAPTVAATRIVEAAAADEAPEATARAWAVLAACVEELLGALEELERG